MVLSLEDAEIFYTKYLNRNPRRRPVRCSVGFDIVQPFAIATTNPLPARAATERADIQTIPPSQASTLFIVCDACCQSCGQNTQNTANPGNRRHI